MHILKPAIPSTSAELLSLMKNSLVIDIETTIASDPLPPGCQFAASPHHADNRVVAIGAGKPELITGQPVLSSRHAHIIIGAERNTYQDKYYKDEESRIMFQEFLDEYFTKDNNLKLLIGHNIAFDLMYQIQGYVNKLGDILIWDTMLAEKYLTNQKTGLKLSLEDCCERHGIDFEKDTEVSDSFKLGIGSDKIHPNTLRKYLYHDVQATDKLFLEQHRKAMEIGGVSYVRYLLGLMSARLATVRMELSGMYVDPNIFEENKAHQKEQVELLEAELIDKMTLCLPAETKAKVTPASAKQIKTVLFGGSVECVRDIHVRNDDGTFAKYKTGPRAGTYKFKKESYQQQIDGVVDEVPAGLNKSSVDDKTLQDLLAFSKTNFQVSRALVKFLDDLISYRAVSKNYSTYYEGMSKHIWTTQDNCIHPQYNHAIAVTKRLTSSKPNMQNVSNKGKN